jgi:hypothetical protein
MPQGAPSAQLPGRRGWQFTPAPEIEHEPEDPPDPDATHQASRDMARERSRSMSGGGAGKAARAGSGSGSLTATGGAAIDLSDSAFLHVGASLDGARFATLSDLDRCRGDDDGLCGDGVRTVPGPGHDAGHRPGLRAGARCWE